MIKCFAYLFFVSMHNYTKDRKDRTPHEKRENQIVSHATTPQPINIYPISIKYFMRKS